MFQLGRFNHQPVCVRNDHLMNVSTISHLKLLGSSCRGREIAFYVTRVFQGSYQKMGGSSGVDIAKRFQVGLTVVLNLFQKKTVSEDVCFFFSDVWLFNSRWVQPHIVFV